MKIAGYLKTSLIEWPGKITSVIFVPGCNFRCPFCHNQDLVDPRRIKKLPRYQEKTILADLKKRKKWIDGVVVTGGEPTLQPKLEEFLREVKKLDFLTMIETNGTNPKLLKNLLAEKLLDYITIDFKGPWGEYEKFTNCSNQASKVKLSLKEVIQSGVEFELRTTIIPGLHRQETLLAQAEELKVFIKNSRPKIKEFRWFLQNFRPQNCLDPRFQKKSPFPRAIVKTFLKSVKTRLPTTEFRDN